MKVLISMALALFLVGCGSDIEREAEAQKQEAVAKMEAIAKTEPVKVESDVIAEALKDEAVASAETAKEEVVAAVEIVKEEAALVQASGATLYQVCAGCHGADASKAALGKSQIIKGWDAAKIADALHGYKAGTYGGAMKGLMIGQVSKLSDDDIKTLSEHISKL